MSEKTDGEFPVESWTPFPTRDDVLYGEYTPARVMTDEEAVEHRRRIAAKFDAAGIPRPEWLRGVGTPTQPTRIGPQGEPDDGEPRSPVTESTPAADPEKAGEAPDPEIEDIERVGMTTEQIRKAGLVIDLPMEAASADPQPLRYDDD